MLFCRIRSRLLRIASAGVLAVLLVLASHGIAHAASVQITGTVVDQKGNAVQNEAYSACIL